MKRTLVRFFSGIVILLLMSIASLAQTEFDFSEKCKQAYGLITEFKFEKGQALLDQEKQSNPNNLIPYFIENYIDFFVLFFNEDPAEFKKRLPNLSKRLDLLSKGNDESPFYLFTRSIIHFQWAAVKIKFGNNWDAGWEFRRSFLQVKENQQKFPEFFPNQLYLGSMQVAAGTIPDGYKWLSNILGIRGTIRQGMKTLENFLQQKDSWSQLFRTEAVFYYSYLKFYIENDKSGVLEFINGQRLDLRNNHLFAYLAANLYLNSQQSEKAIAVIQNRAISPDYFRSPIWDLELGYAKLNRQEADANIYLEKFIDQFKGRSYLRDALQKLSWHYYLQNDLLKAEQYRKRILSAKGSDLEADKQALKEAKTAVWPNKLLLKSRLLNDGGYYREALQLLHGKKFTDFTAPQDQTEFAYRVGRLYDDLGADDEAIGFYKEAIQLGKDRKEYFAARAALHIGNIYEKKGNCVGATGWYQACLNMKDHDFKNSLDQRAKAGMARCKNL